MSKVCEISGKKPITANSIIRRGKAKREGGVGRKTTGISKRWQKPNLHKVRVQVAGQEITFRVAASHIDKVYELLDRAKGMKLEGLSPKEIKARLLKLL
ncbi:MAG: 50S ribosomal protein L28 [Thermaceae bacterium]